MNENLNQLPGALLPWYEANKRSLPWRQDKDPYHIWLSEIMLQQTRVEAVKGYYHRFLTAVPTIADLAQADEELLLKLWEGLGYYSRVRNLKKAAQVILTNYGGKFPQDHKDVLALPGIGDYTAGAICSIAFGQKQPAVDGNVLRVMARLQADATPIDQPARKKEVQALLADVYPENAGDFTQALMELGATVCGPNRGPDCENCPCNSFCQGYQQGIAAKLPVKTAKKARRIEEKTEERDQRAKDQRPALRWAVCPGQTPGQWLAGGAVAISGTDGNFGTSPGHCGVRYSCEGSVPPSGKEAYFYTY